MRTFLTRRSAIALAAVVALSGITTAAHAVGGFGDIVFDPTNYAQIVKTVQSWERQYQQMQMVLSKAEATVQQTKAAVAAATGNRGFGNLLNNPLLKSIVPDDVLKTLSSLNRTGALIGNAANLRRAAMLYDCADIVDPAAQVSCRALLGQNAQAQALQQDTLAKLIERSNQIDGLRAEISRTQDPKSIAELQARLQAELAQVSNDQNKIVVSTSMLALSQAAAAQSAQERVNALMATNKPSVLDSYSFDDLDYKPLALTSRVDQ